MGFRGGLNISTLTSAQLDHKTNAYLGFIYQSRISEFYAIQPELGYSNQGGRTKNKQNIHIEYITISVNNKFFLIPQSGFYALLSPGLDFDVDDTFIGLANRTNNHGNRVTFIDINLSLGLGLEFKNGLAIEARYKQGFVDVYSGAFHNFENNLYQDKAQLNAVVQIGIAYKFNLTKKE